MLTKQLEEGLELRRKMEEQTKDLQRQLKMERDENKNLNKRSVALFFLHHHQPCYHFAHSINLLETELRETSGDRRKSSDVGAAAVDIDALQQVCCARSLADHVNAITASNVC